MAATDPAVTGSMVGSPGVLANDVWIMQRGGGAPTLPDLAAQARGVALVNTLTFELRQGAGNTLENTNTVPQVESISVALIKGYDVDGSGPLALDQRNEPQMSGFIQSMTLGPAAVAAGVTLQADGSALLPNPLGDLAWHSYTLDFTADCTGCQLGIRVDYGTWGSWNAVFEYFVRGVSLSRPAVGLPSPQAAYESSTLISLPKQAQWDPTATPPARTACPHERAGLVLWSEAFGAGGAPTGAGVDVEIPAGTSVLVRQCDLQGEPYGVITVPAGTELVFDDSDMVLHAHEISVMGGAVLMGSPTCRLYSHIELVFHGTFVSGQGHPNKGLLVHTGGQVDMHGKEFRPTWARLASSAFAGDSRLYLQDVANWEVGQSIVVVSSAFIDHDDDHHNEYRTIVAIDTSVADLTGGTTGTTIVLDAPLEHLHYAGSEYQTEVGLISRRIVARGADGSAAQNFGGQLRVMHGGQGRFSGVLADQMGAKNVLGRYPFHFHVAGEAVNSYVTDSAIYRSFYRCIVIHATHGVILHGNVAADVTGHCYYLEDGIEERNTIEYNLAAHVHVIGTPASGGGQPGETFWESDTLRQPADAAAAGFYITNTYNWIRGNAASGGWAGFSLPNLPRPLGPSRIAFSDPATCAYTEPDDADRPQNRPTLQFDGNTAHSTGSFWESGSCIYVGGRLEEHYDATDGCAARLEYNSGRNERRTVNSDGSIAFTTFTNTRVWQCTRGVQHWGIRSEVRGLEAHDVGRSATLFGSTYFYTALVNARSGNPEAAIGRWNFKGYEGFELYDTWTSTVLENIEFRNYNTASCLFNAGQTRNCDVWHELTHSDVFKPQSMSAMRGIRYTNVDRRRIIRHTQAATGSSWMFNFIDYDGSATRRSQPTLVGSDRDWWRWHPQCEKDADWQVWLCPHQPETADIAYLYLEIPGVTFTQQTSFYAPDYWDGYISLMGATNRSIPFTSNPGITGVDRPGWYLKLYPGSPASWGISTLQMRRGRHVVLAMPYPAGTTFSIVATQIYAWPSAFDHPVPQAASLADVLHRDESLLDPADFVCPSYGLCTTTGGRGPLWFYDTASQMLYLRIVDLRHYHSASYDSPEGFVRSGMRINGITNNYYYKVEASCAAGTAESRPGRSGDGFAAGEVVPTATFCVPTAPDAIPNPHAEAALADCSSSASVPNTVAYGGFAWTTQDPGVAGTETMTIGQRQLWKLGSLGSLNMRVRGTAEEPECGVVL